MNAMEGNEVSAPKSFPYRPLVFLDSGIGGLPYLERARELLPEESYVYVADRENFPYGAKTRKEVVSLVEGLCARMLKKFDPEIIVIACNTMSVSALDSVRKAFPDIPFIGTVPAVKPAAERSRARKIGVLATARTVNDPYIDFLVGQYARDCEVVRIAGTDIVEFVERRLFDSTARERMEVVEEAVREFKERGVDEIILACTHFLHLEDDIRALAGSGIEILDSREGVARQAWRVLSGIKRREARGSIPSGESSGRLYLTGESPFETVYSSFAARYGLVLADRWE
jgi:glutamate racemase